jgi:hypothetical protein
MLIIEEIKKEMEQDLLGISLDQHEGKIALHYYRDGFRNRFKDYSFIPRTSHNEQYPWEATADLGDGITAFCLITEEMKKQWEAERNDNRRNDTTDSQKCAS